MLDVALGFKWPVGAAESRRENVGERALFEPGPVENWPASCAASGRFLEEARESPGFWGQAFGGRSLLGTFLLDK